MQEIIKTRAVQVLRVLSGLDTKTGLLVISEALRMAAEQAGRELFGSVKMPPVKRRMKSERHLFKIEKDQAIMDFVHAQEEPLVVTKIHKAIVERFGVQRAPSNSSVHRYLQHLSRQSEVATAQDS